MPTRVLHVVDASTSSDAMEMLGHLLTRAGVEQRVVAMGHRSSAAVGEMGGIPRNAMNFVSSNGWADPSGWRSLRREIATFAPTHIQTWGVSGVVATEVSGFAGEKIAVVAETPRWGHLRLMRVVDGGRFSRGKKSRWKWLAGSSSIVRSLLAGGLNAERVLRVRPGISPGNAGAPVDGRLGLRKRLGILDDQGPIFLMGGEGRNARHDYGLWCGAILQQFFPQLKVVVRLDVRGRNNIGLDRLVGTLPDEDMLVLAPVEMPWAELVHAADLLVITADGPTPTGSILHAMAATIPVIGTPIECVSELVEHGHNGLLAKTVKPRAIAARIEEFMSDSTLKWPLTDRARADIYGHFSVSAMVEGMRDIWTRGNSNDDAQMANPIQIGGQLGI